MTFQEDDEESVGSSEDESPVDKENLTIVSREEAQVLVKAADIFPQEKTLPRTDQSVKPEEIPEVRIADIPEVRVVDIPEVRSEVQIIVNDHNGHQSVPMAPVPSLQFDLVEDLVGSSDEEDNRDAQHNDHDAGLPDPVRDHT